MRNTQHVAAKRFAYKPEFYEITYNVLRPHLLLDATLRFSLQGQRFYPSCVETIFFFFFGKKKFAYDSFLLFDMLKKKCQRESSPCGVNKLLEDKRRNYIEFKLKILNRVELIKTF